MKMAIEADKHSVNAIHKMNKENKRTLCWNEYIYIYGKLNDVKILCTQVNNNAAAPQGGIGFS